MHKRMDRQMETCKPVTHANVGAKTISEVKLAVKFYSLLTSFRVITRLDIRTQTNEKMDETTKRRKLACLSVFAMFQDRSFNIMLANNFINP